MIYVHSYNEYQYIQDSKSQVGSYLIKVEKNILYLKAQTGGYVKFGRIEKVTDFQFKFYAISENLNNYSESLLGFFNKNIESIETNREDVIKNQSFLNAFSGIWNEQPNSGNKNIINDFSDNKNYFWRRYETSDGSKKGIKYEFKIEPDGTLKTVAWGSYFQSGWSNHKITVSPDNKKTTLTGILGTTTNYAWER
jgi:hypothetical protein